MTLGLALPGVSVVHPRESWEPLSGVPTIANMNPPLQYMWKIHQPVAHYTAADNLIDGDPGEYAHQLDNYIAAIHRDYVTNRGYAIGYLFAIDWLGGAWELRGFDYKSAANAGHNEYTFPILFLVDGPSRATPAMWDTARNIWREARRRSANQFFKDRPLGHGQLYTTTGTGTPTACPGGGIINDLAEGKGDLSYQENDMDFDFLARMERMHDSRPGHHQTGTVQQVRLQPGENRRVPLGLATTHGVRLTVVGSQGSGFVSITGTPGIGDPTVNMWDGRQGDGTMFLDTPEGAGYVATTTSCDIVVDVFFRGANLET